MRRGFARNPRAFLREALEERLGEEGLEQLFVETVEFSSRVRELGLWQPPVLPWVQREAGKWLPDDPRTRPKGGLVLPDGRQIEIPPADVGDLQAAVEEAVAAGRPTVAYRGAEIPASPETAKALAQLPGAMQPDRRAEAREDVRIGRQVLLIEENFESLGFQRQLTPRSDQGAEGEPDDLGRGACPSSPCARPRAATAPGQRRDPSPAAPAGGGYAPRRTGARHREP